VHARQSSARPSPMCIDYADRTQKSDTGNH
jgi:hypothetical protein